MENCGGTHHVFGIDGRADGSNDAKRRAMMKSDPVCAHTLSVSPELTHQTLREVLGLKPLLGAMATPAPLWKRVYTRWCRHLLL